MRPPAAYGAKSRRYQRHLFTLPSVAMTCSIKREYAISLWCVQQGAKRYADGLGMLVGQAAHAVLLWHGVLPQVEPVIEQLQQELLA